MESASEKRRRRILERGASRLAFVTGQAAPPPPNLPEDSPPLPPINNGVPSFLDDARIGPEHLESGYSASGTLEIEDRKELFPKHETSREPLKFMTSIETPRSERSNEISECETSNEPSKTNNGRSTELLTTSVAPISSSQFGDTTHIAPKTARRLITSSQISRSISASEDIRLLSTVLIALSVVVSCHGFSIGSKVMQSIISFRPLLLVLITDATIILGPLLAIPAREHVHVEEPQRTGQEERYWANDIGEALGVALVVQKALSAVFMDCSICAVIMICGCVF